MKPEEVLVALCGGPLAGRVVDADVGQTQIEIPVTTVWGFKTHIYRVMKHDGEIVEAFYERTRSG